METVQDLRNTRKVSFVKSAGKLEGVMCWILPHLAPAG